MFLLKFVQARQGAVGEAAEFGADEGFPVGFVWGFLVFVEFR